MEPESAKMSQSKQANRNKVCAKHGMFHSGCLAQCNARTPTDRQRHMHAFPVVSRAISHYEVSLATQASRNAPRDNKTSIAFRADTEASEALIGEETFEGRHRTDSIAARTVAWWIAISPK